MSRKTSRLVTEWIIRRFTENYEVDLVLDELREAELARQQYTSNVTHELKTPLTSISGAAELMRDGLVPPEDVPLFAERILDASRHLTVLVDDILTLSRLDESERMGDRTALGALETFNLLTICQATVDRNEAAAFDMHVSVNACGEPVEVLGNGRLLDQLVGNLVNNAIRYNREGGSVDVWCGTEDGHPVLRVSDTGQGIPLEAQGKVFERFFRVDPGRSRATGGTGLGLAIVKHAAAFHDAEIQLESTPGQGTTITVVFPPQGD